MVARRPKRTKQHPMLAALARAKAANIMVQVLGPGQWLVDSQTGRHKHLVTCTPTDGWNCACEATRYCAHIAAAQTQDKSFITEYRRQLERDRLTEEREWNRMVEAQERANGAPLPDDEYQRLYGDQYPDDEGIDYFEPSQWRADEIHRRKPHDRQ